MVLVSASSLIFDAVKFVLGALVGAVIVKRVEGKAELITHLGHVSAFTLRNPGQPPVVIHTHDVVIRNAGRKPANNVRVSHNVLPDQFNVNPSVPYTVEQLPAGNKDIVIPKLVPRQQIVISYLYYPPTTFNEINSGIRSDEGFATPVEIELSEKTSAWATAIGAIGFIIGCLTVLYLIWRGLKYIGM